MRALSRSEFGYSTTFATDVDGDGDTDLLAANDVNGAIEWYENDGTPSVRAQVVHTISVAADGAQSVFVADVDDSGIVDFDDVDAYRDSLADPVGLALTPAGVAKCSVIDGAGPCEILDVTVIERALEPTPLAPGIDQVCSAVGGP